YTVRKPSENNRLHPTLHRYWVHMPAAGNISLFCSSWYREVSTACFESKAARKHLNQSYLDIINLESQLITDGVVLIKFFLHISCKEQKRRLKALESKKSTRWLVDKEDWYQNEHYDEYLRLYDAMIARTHFDGAQWHVLHSDNKRTCIRQIYGAVIESFQAALRDREANLRAWDTPFLPHLESLPTVTMPPLEAFDPEQALTDPYKPAVDAAQRRLRKLQNELYRKGISMVVCFEGWDAAGKGGAIRRLTSSLDARGYDVVPIASPTPLEKSHHYLWRFWRELPRDGHIAIFDRTWYGRVMVERIEGYCTEPQWQRAYEEINRFEANITDHGTILCKFWLQIDSETQLARFNDRENTWDKQWKITPEDWRNREKWPLYEVAVSEMLQKTNTATAPWTVVEANNKQFARLKVLQTVITTIEKRLEGITD
ncbi:MAG TPA: phosphate--AMP phosphotransferase, partial [Candidatus Limiplasma sp.]|nr:phosphate--AMP phosphotransferase [Candidatus Limiplasma sp.]